MIITYQITFEFFDMREKKTKFDRASNTSIQNFDFFNLILKKKKEIILCRFCFFTVEMTIFDHITHNNMEENLIRDRTFKKFRLRVQKNSK